MLSLVSHSPGPFGNGEEVICSKARHSRFSIMIYDSARLVLCVIAHAAGLCDVMQMHFRIVNANSFCFIIVVGTNQTKRRRNREACNLAGKSLIEPKLG